MAVFLFFEQPQPGVLDQKTYPETFRFQGNIGNMCLIDR